MSARSEVAVIVGVEHAVQTLGDERGGALYNRRCAGQSAGHPCGARADFHVLELVFGELE